MFSRNLPHASREFKTPGGKSFALWFADLIKDAYPQAAAQIIENADKIDGSIKSSRVLYESYDGSDWTNNFHHEEIRKGKKGLFIEVSQWIWDELWEKGCRSDFERFLDAGDADVDYYYDEYPLWLYLAEGWADWSTAAQNLKSVQMAAHGPKRKKRRNTPRPKLHVN